VRTLKPYPLATAANVARQYAFRFRGASLRERVAELLAQYPDVRAPNWISWEGGTLTNVQTTARLRMLLDALDILDTADYTSTGV